MHEYTIVTVRLIDKYWVPTVSHVSGPEMTEEKILPLYEKLSNAGHKPVFICKGHQCNLLKSIRENIVPPISYIDIEG